MTRQLLLTSLAMAGLCAAGTAPAQPYPNWPLRLMIPFPPDGATAQEFTSHIASETVK